MTLTSIRLRAVFLLLTIFGLLPLLTAPRLWWLSALLLVVLALCRPASAWREMGAPKGSRQVAPKGSRR